MTKKLQSAGSLKIRSLLSKRRRPQARPSAEQRQQLQFENLERRHVLNGVPIANPDPFYLGTTGTALVVSAGSGVTQNDFDADGPNNVTVNAVGNATNGTISAWGSDGSFTFTPSSGFAGFASFTYTVTDGTSTSESAKVTISFGQTFSADLLPTEAGAGNPLHSGALETAIPISSDFGLVYRSDTVDPKPVIAVETIFNGAPSGTTLTSISAQLKRNGTNDGSAVTYTQSLPSSAGTKLRFALQSVDSTALASGLYDYTISLTANFSNSTSSTTDFTVSKAIVNRSNDSSTKRSAFGEGWWLDGLDQLYSNSAGVLWVHGNGDAYWFKYNGSTYDKAVGDTTFSTLTKPNSTTHKITDKWGNEKTFEIESDNVTCTLVSIKRLNNVSNSYAFTYDSSNRLTTITDEFGRNFTFTINGTTGLVSNFKDFANRQTDFAWHGSDAGVLTSVTLPTQPGGAASHLQYSNIVWTLAYSSSKLSQLTDPDGNYDQFTYYSTSGLFNKVIHGNNLSTWELFPTLGEGLKTGTGNSVYVVADDISASGSNAGKYIDERGYDFRFKTDQFGNVTQLHDEAGALWKYEYSPTNLLYRSTAPDADGNGSVYVILVTKYGYNSMGDLLSLVHPDGKKLVWTFDATLHLPLTLVNELNKTIETNTYDSVGNLLTTKDANNNTWTNTYDQTDSNSANRHGRLLTVTSPDPDGAGNLTPSITTFEYLTNHSNYRLVKKIINPDNGATESDVEFAYDSNDNLTSVTNELGFVTSYDYDNLDRLRKTTLTAASSGGSQPTYFVAYNGKNQVTKETDPLGNYTEYVYDNRGWLQDAKRRDSGNNLIATTSYTYFQTGELNTLKLPSYSGSAVDTYTYDLNGNVATFAAAQGGQTSYTYDLMGRLNQVDDPYGRTINYEYDTRNRLAKVQDEDPDGSGYRGRPTTEYYYDDASQLTSVVDPLGRTTAYAYADNGWLTSMTLPDPDGSGSATSPVWTYSYDTLGRKTKVEDPERPSYYSNGRPTTMEYDKRSRLTKVTYPDPDGSGSQLAQSESYTYDVGGRVTNESGTVIAYDNLGRVTSKTLKDPDGAGSLSSPVFSYQYDLAGNVTKSTDPIGNFTDAFTEYEYDALYRVIEVTQPDPDGSGSLAAPVWTYAYTGNRLSSVTDPLSHATSFGYDDAGRQTTVTHPDPDGAGGVSAAVDTYAYNYLNLVTSITSDPDGSGSAPTSVVSYGYDALSRLTTITDPLGKVTTNEYDNANQLLSLKDPLGNETRWGYDNLGRGTIETNAFGYARTYEYNPSGELARRVDRLGRIIEFTVDHLDRKTAEKWYDAASTAPYVVVATTTQGSGSASEVQTVTVSNLTSGTFRLTFDGQVTAAINYNASASNVESALEALNSMDNVTVTGSNGSFTVTFAGTQANKDLPQMAGDAKLSANGTLVRTLSYTFDEKSRMTAASDPTGAYTWTYDELARVITEKADFTGISLTPKIWLYKTYDAAGNRTELSAKFDQIVDEMPTITKDFKNAYTFDKLSRLTKIQQTNQSAGGGGYYAVADKQVDISYNALGQFTQIDRFENLTGTKPTLRALFSYDNANRMTELNYRNIDTSNNSTVLNDYDFVYDQMSRITSITSTADGVTAITYDKRSQVTAADHASPRSDESYGYDDNGNRTGGSYSVGTNNQTTADGTYSYTYDKEGNRTRRTKTSDGSYEDYTWDHRNRLTKVTFKNSGGTELKNVEYAYDVFNRLIRRKYDADGPGSGAATNLFLVGYDGINPTLGFDGTAQADVSNRFLWGPQVDQLFADEQVTNPSSAGNTLWPLGDQVGTLRDIADYNGTAYTITNHRTYDSFGNLTAESQSSVDEIFAYTGKFFDEVTKLSNHLNRWFDPGLGKWVSEDPIGFLAGDFNLSRYVSNFSTAKVDTNGLETIGASPTGQTQAGILSPASNFGFSVPDTTIIIRSGSAGSAQEDEGSDKYREVIGLLPLFVDELKKIAKSGHKDQGFNEQGGAILLALDPNAKDRIKIAQGVSKIDSDHEVLFQFFGSTEKVTPDSRFPLPNKDGKVDYDLFIEVNGIKQTDGTTAFPEKDKNGKDLFYSDYAILAPWHTHPSNGLPSKEDKDNSILWGAVQIVITYTPIPRGGKILDDWKIEIIDIDGTLRDWPKK